MPDKQDLKTRLSRIHGQLTAGTIGRRDAERQVQVLLRQADVPSLVLDIISENSHLRIQNRDLDERNRQLNHQLVHSDPKR